MVIARICCICRARPHRPHAGALPLPDEALGTALAARPGLHSTRALGTALAARPGLHSTRARLRACRALRATAA